MIASPRRAKIKFNGPGDADNEDMEYHNIPGQFNFFWAILGAATTHVGNHHSL